MHEAQRALVIREALTWLGTPFHMGAQIKGGGVDCGRLLVAVYAAAGFTVPEDIEHFTGQFMLHDRDERYLRIIMDYTHPVLRPEPADLVMFHRGRVYSHSAIVIEWPQVIHANERGRGVEWADASQTPLSKWPSLFLSPFGKPA